MSKSSKIPLDLKQFMLRRKALNLYRDIFRTIRLIPDANSRNELKEWVRQDFRSNQHQTDEMAIKMLLQYGKRNLKELQTNLDLCGYYLTANNNNNNKGFKKK